MGLIWTVISSIITGAILGAVARLLIPGKQSISMVMTIIAGIVGALVGGFVAGLFGVAQTSGIDWIRLGLEVVFAVVAVLGAVKLTGKSST